MEAETAFGEFERKTIGLLWREIKNENRWRDDIDACIFERRGEKTRITFAVFSVGLEILGLFFCLFYKPTITGHFFYFGLKSGLHVGFCFSLYFGLRFQPVPSYRIYQFIYPSGYEISYRLSVNKKRRFGLLDEQNRIANLLTNGSRFTHH